MFKPKYKENDPTVIEQLKSIFPEEEQLLNAGLENADCMIWFVNRQFKLVYFNNAFKEYIFKHYHEGVKIGDYFGNLAHLFGVVFQKYWKDYCAKALDGTIFTTNETVKLYKNSQDLLTDSSSTMHLKIHLSQIHGQNRTRGLCMFAFDISDQINYVKKCEQQKIYYEQLIERSSDITLILDEVGNIIYASNAIKNYIDNEIESIIGLNIFKTFVSEEDVENFHESFENVKKVPDNSVQIKIKLKSPKVGEIWLHVLLSNYLDIPPLNAVVCSIRVLDQDLFTVEEEIDIFPYQQLIDASSELYLMIDKDGKFCYGSPSIKSYLGYEKEQYIGKSLFHVLHPDCWEYAHKKLEEAITKPREGFEITLQLVDRSGMKKWIKGTACNLLNVPGIQAIIGHFRDVGEQLVMDKTEETQLKTIQQYYQQVSIPIIICEPEFLRIIQINDSALKFLGYDAIDLKTRTALDLLPSEYHANIQSLTTSESNALSSNGKIIAQRLISKNSKVVWGDVVANVIKSDTCDLVSLTIREKISDNKNANNLIYSKINNDLSVLKATMEAQENERVEIGRELHDNILQLLGTINLYLDCLRQEEVHKYDPEDIITKAENTSQLIIKEIRKVSHNLIKSYSEDVGLKLSVEDLLDSVSLMNSFKAQLDYINVVDSDLSHDLKLNIYRIIQEQINNIIKHANAQYVTVRLTQAASILTLQIIDDGGGIENDLEFSAGVGLKNIRNRVHLYNGELIFKTLPNRQGCMLMASFKLHTKS